MRCITAMCNAAVMGNAALLTKHRQLRSCLQPNELLGLTSSARCPPGGAGQPGDVGHVDAYGQMWGVKMWGRVMRGNRVWGREV